MTAHYLLPVVRQARFAALLLFFSVPALLRAEVHLPHVLSDHMLLQRNAPIHIWGWADAGDAIGVNFGDDRAQATADALGEWSIFLPPHPAGGPYELRVQGSGAVSIRLTDIMVGDLWIASGQSNMEIPLSGWTGAPIKDGPKEIAAANHPNIRLLRLPQTVSEYPLQDTAATWTRCTPETAKDFSAVAYFFGREIENREHVPVGLIDSTWGGTPAESWTSAEAFGNPALSPVWPVWSRFAVSLAQLPAVVAAEKREDEQRRQAGQPAAPHPWHPPAQAYLPSVLFNGMIAPLTPLSIRGVIWYQGEANSSLDRALLYHELFPAMIADWRSHFQQGAFPFLFAQISSFTATPNEGWGLVRDAQRRTLAVATTAMAVTMDVGEPDNVHPADKLTVGHRLALAARALSYGEAVHFAGPIFARADIEGDHVRVGFEDRTARLACAAACTGFEVAASDHRFVPADAVVEGSSVLVRSPAVPRPAFVRYAWANAPAANLFDAEGLPASTFTSELEVVDSALRAAAR